MTLRETKLRNTIDSISFSLRSYIYLNWKDFVIHMLGLMVKVKKGEFEHGAV